MKYITLPNTNLKAARIGLGCMRISDMTIEALEELVFAALESGVNFFDHADIYGGGQSESLFGEVLKRNPAIRNNMIIQTKCGIIPGGSPGKRFDSSKEHIVASAKKSLERLQTDYIDLLLLHRPDALADPREIAEAFDELQKSGLVHHFGVSNYTPMQMQLLQKHLKSPLIVNQIQLSIIHSTALDAGMFMNMTAPEAVDRDNGVIDYCHLNDITIQPWCPLQASWAEGTFLDHPNYPKLNKTLQTLADEYGVNKNAIALAWLLRHPAEMQPIVGTTSVKRLKELVKATDVELTRQHWYDIYLAEEKPLP